MEEKLETRKFSFFVKEPMTCPVCQAPIFKEEMLTGRGRLSAKDLTVELRREYALIPGLGIITPLMYSISSCSQCFFSLFNNDFNTVKLTPPIIEKLQSEKEKRKLMIQNLFKQEMDFTKPKTLSMAAASYYLALSSYSPLPSKYSPSIKSSIAIIRFYWLLEDLKNTQPNNIAYWSSIREKLKPKVLQYLQSSYAKVQKNEEELTFFGPDTDRNNGFEGLVYMHHYFSYINMPKDNPMVIEETCKKIKRDLSKIFGLGKVSKERPVAILDVVRKLYESVKEELKKLSIDDEDF